MGTKFDDFLIRVFGWLPARTALAIMSFFGFVNLYMVRLNLSVTIVAMVDKTSTSYTHSACTSLNTTSESSDLDLTTTTSPTLDQPKDEMAWSPTIQGVILGSFFYGYTTTQVLGGRAAEMYGTRLVFGLCILAGGLITLIIPLAATTHYTFLVALRVLQGACQGVSWPAMHALITLWIPPLERPRFIGYVYFATTLSTSVTLPLCGLITAHLGWEAAFYVTGALSLLWCVLWFPLMHDTPSHHPRITDEELKYIVSTVQDAGRGESAKSTPVPWCKVFTSLPMWAIIIHGLGNNWGIALFFSQLPTYMNNVLGFSIKENGALSALPFLCRYLGAIAWGSIAHLCNSRGYLSVLATRRIASIISMWMPALMLMFLAYSGCDWVAALSLMCTALFCNGAITASGFVNHTDIAPNFSGTLFGLDNTLGGIIAFIVPLVVGIITDGQQTLGQWRKVFWTCVPMYGISEIFYLVFASASVQRWNTPDQHKDTTDDDNKEV